MHFCVRSLVRTASATTQFTGSHIYRREIVVCIDGERGIVAHNCSGEEGAYKVSGRQVSGETQVKGGYTLTRCIGLGYKCVIGDKHIESVGLAPGVESAACIGRGGQM